MSELHASRSLIGRYAFKDRRMPGFAWRSHEMTQGHIDLCIQTHERHTHGYGVGKLMITKANWATKTYGFYHRNFSPLDVGPARPG